MLWQAFARDCYNKSKPKPGNRLSAKGVKHSANCEMTIQRPDTFAIARAGAIDKHCHLPFVADYVCHFAVVCRSSFYLGNTYLRIRSQRSGIIL